MFCMFDIVGNRNKAVAIIEGDKKQAVEILEKYKNVKSVLKKISGREGIYRIYRMRLLAGEKNTEVVHKEYGYLLNMAWYDCESLEDKIGRDRYLGPLK